MKTCSCRSYNAQIGDVPEVILPRPGFLPEGERVNGVPVDACISPVIEYLWSKGVSTLSSCCGHNGKLGSPSIVLGGAEENYSQIRELIAEIDPRHFDLSQWRRVVV